MVEEYAELYHWVYLAFYLIQLCLLEKNLFCIFPEARARICRPYKEHRNWFPVWRAGTATLFDVPASQATLAGGIDSLESIPGLLKRQQIRAQPSETVVWLITLISTRGCALRLGLDCLAEFITG